MRAGSSFVHAVAAALARAARGTGDTAIAVALGIVAAGWLLNLAPIAANGAMPFDRAALEGRTVAETLSEEGVLIPKRTLLTAETRLGALVFAGMRARPVTAAARRA